MTNKELIDQFKAVHNVKTNKEVLEILGMRAKSAQVTDWRNGHRPMPLSIKFQLLEHISHPYSREFALLFLDPGKYIDDFNAQKSRIAGRVGGE